jgi:tRNA(fMet)-specific endonuclease VapC
MPARYLLDTDICIYLRSNDRPKITERFAALDRDEAAVSVITFGELAYGAARSNDPVRAAQAIEWLTRTVQILPLPTNAAPVYGEIRAGLSVPGRLVGPNDLWIAAHALAENLVLVTNNEREFRRIKGLKIENWAR